MTEKLKESQRKRETGWRGGGVPKESRCVVFRRDSPGVREKAES